MRSRACAAPCAGSVVGGIRGRAVDAGAVNAPASEFDALDPSKHVQEGPFQHFSMSRVRRHIGTQDEYVDGSPWARLFFVQKTRQQSSPALLSMGRRHCL